MKYGKPMTRLLVGMALAMTPAVASADGDSSADASGGYNDYIRQSSAVVIKVPVNAQGDELVEAAEMRTFAGEAISSNTAAIKTTFDSAQTIEGTPQLSEEGDSSTTSWGWYGWRGQYGYNYGNNYGYHRNYYYNYRPQYYYGSGYYNYRSPYYYNHYYSSGGYYGYRYYYYPRY